MNKRENVIARQMMRGLDGKIATPEQIDQFKKAHKDIICWIDENMPTHIAGKHTSVGVLGAVGKGVLWYGTEKMQPFCKALNKGEFNGLGDPAHVLWLYLTGRVKYNRKAAYKKTVSAIRAYVVGKQLMRLRNGQKATNCMHSAETDLFEWDNNFTIMVHRDSKSRKTFKVALTEEARLEQEVNEALASLT